MKVSKTFLTLPSYKPMTEQNSAEIFDLPVDVIRFICVHCEYNEIITGIYLTCSRLNKIVEQLLQSNYYIYRLHITDVRCDDDPRVFKITQIKYFEQYKDLLSNNEKLDKRLPITYVLLTYNFHHLQQLTKNNHISTQFKPWLFKYWNNGSIYEIVTVTVNIFDQFLNIIHAKQDEAKENNQVDLPPEKNALSLNDTVRYLRLTNRGAPQPINDYNRLCNALSIIDKYNVSKSNDIPKIYGFSIGFHVKDNRKQDYLEKNFLPFSKYLQNLRVLVLHGCHKRDSKSNDNIDLLDGVLNEINDNIIYLDLSFMISQRRPYNNNNANNDENKDEDDLYLMKFPESVECINFGYDFETYDEKIIKVSNIEKLTKLKSLYIEMNPKRIQIEFMGQFITKCESLECIAINLGGMVWENLSIQQTEKLENINKYWKLSSNERNKELNVIIITTQGGVHSAFKKIINNTFGDNSMVKIEYLDRKAGIEWLFEYVNQNIGQQDYIFNKLWKTYHFGRSNFSSLKVVFQ